MPDMLAATTAIAAGFVLGVLFYGGLWWTVRHAADFRRPALAVLGSALLRMAIALGGFYLAAGGEWSRMLLCLLGFVLARLVVTWATRKPMPSSPSGRPAMRLSPDEWIFWQNGFVKLNATIVFTWALMLVMTVGSALVTRKLSHGRTISRWQSLLEIVVTSIQTQIQEIGLQQPRKYLAFLGTLFLFVAASSLCTVIPGFEPPTGSLSTTAALAACVFVAVPAFGIAGQGLGGYLKTYVEPTVVMLPFNLISELSRTLALAVRLFGNMMSGAMIMAILLTHHALRLPGRDDGARPADRHGPGLHLQHPGGGLHRRGHSRAPARGPAARSRSPPLHNLRERPTWTA